MTYDPEQQMRKVRRLLTLAHHYEVAGKIEAADAFGAMAANRLAGVVRHMNGDNVVYLPVTGQVRGGDKA